MVSLNWRGFAATRFQATQSDPQSDERAPGRTGGRRQGAKRRRRSFGLEPLEARVVLAADVIISEIGASNNSIEDDNGDFSDWIELFNNGDEAANLAGWYLTDDPAELTQWQFPTNDPGGDLVLEPDEYMVIWASDKNRTLASADLHTNFRLTADGEFLALVAADGTTIVDSHNPFPEQFADISWGPEQATVTHTFVGDDAPVSVLLPSSAGQDVPTATWTAPGYNDATWAGRNFGVGFDGGGELNDLIHANGSLSSMQGSTASAYVRSEFTIDGAAPNLDEFDLNINYDDGFIAYLNGTEIARRNAPAGNGAWNSQATQEHAGLWADIDIDNFEDPATQALFSDVGSAGYFGQRARITANTPNANGALWHKDPIPFGQDFSFNSFMTIDVHTPAGSGAGVDGDGSGAAGMTFVLQSGGEFHIGTGAGGMGLDGLAANYVAVEFDTFATGSFDQGDVLPTHVGIIVSGVGNVARVAVPRFNGGALGANLRYVWVDYDGATDALDVYFSSTTTKPATPTVSTTIDLVNHFEGVPALWAGWTASTMNVPTISWNAHDVVNWEFQTYSNELGVDTEVIDIAQHAGLLTTGTNVLAIHGLNQSASDNDFLLSATLVGRQNNVTFTDRLQYFTSPTPGDPNGEGTDAPSGPVEFSSVGHTFRDNFSLTLTAENPNAVIRYTTDGSLPDESSTEYTGPINVNSSTRIRARAFEPGRAPGKVQSESFVKLATTVANFEGEVFKSNLPIVVFDGFGKTTIDQAFGGGQPRLTPVGGLVYEVGEDGYARLSDEPTMRVNAGMRVRGQTSEGFAKKQYAIEFWEDSIDFTSQLLGSQGPDLDLSFLGLPEDSDWVINGPYSDKTQLNNFLTFNLFREIGQYSPRTRLIEVFVNNNGGELDMATDYRGTYVLLEKIKLGGDRVDGGRTEANPAPGAPPTEVGGYIWKRDKPGFGDVDFTTPGGIPLKFHDPDTPNTAQRNWLTNYVAQFESALNGPNFTDPELGYRNYIDVQSWYDTWLMVELTKQIDGYRLSTYYHFNDEGKIVQGPAWDYNLSFSNANYLQGGRWDSWYWNQVGGADYPFWPRLFQDPEFVSGLHDRWFELRETVFTWENLESMIDDAVDQLTNGNPIHSNAPLPGEPSNPISRNFNRWGTINTYQWPNCFFPGNTTELHCGTSPLPPDMSPNGAPNSYDDYIYIMKNFVRNRLDWIDDQFGRPPELSLEGGLVPDNSELTMTTDDPGEIYYTQDGTDPRTAQQVVETKHAIFDPSDTANYLVPSSSALINACQPNPLSVPNPGGCFINPAYVQGTHGESWTSGTGAIGFDSGDGNFDGLIDTTISGMQGTNGSAYLRIPFNVTAQQKTDAVRWLLDVNYDDGFVAYLWSASLNTPIEIARRNVAGTARILPISPVAYNATASADQSDTAATSGETIDISAIRGYLITGQNYLVVQLANSSAASNDLLFNASLSYTTEHVEFPANVHLYDGPITIDSNQVITARRYDPATETWSSRSRRSYFVDVPPIVITEINYNPADPTNAEENAGFIDNNDFEFIEIMNISDAPYDLSGVTITEGIDFDFTEGTLGPGERGVIVRNPDAFAMRYPGVDVLGTWYDAEDPADTDALSNTGERLLMEGPLGEPIMDFTFVDGWYDLTDGDGFTLAIRNAQGDRTQWGSADSWRPSDRRLGSPGTGDAGLSPNPGAVVVNELVANSTTGDALELFNATAVPINIGNYYLTDNPDNLGRFRIPAGTIVPANGYLVINSSVVPGFSLANNGGEIVLHAATAAGELLGFQETRRFDAADPNVSEGRYVNSVGNVDFVTMTSPTLGAANAPPQVGPIVISEMMYAPTGGNPEWIELYNMSNSAIDLGAQSYVFSEGLNFDFPAGAMIQPRSFVVVVQGQDGANHGQVASAFRTANNVPASVGIYVYEPTANGNLNNGGEDLTVGRSLGAGLPAVPVEFLEYSNTAPWPEDTDETGTTLARVDLRTYGNEPTNWGTGNLGGTPGRENMFRDPSGPSLPQNVHGNLESGSTVVISWTPSLDPESGIDHYNVYKNGQFLASTPIARITDSIVFSSTAPVIYRVSAVNGDGLESEISDTSASLSAQSVSFQHGTNGYNGAQDVEIRSAGAASAAGNLAVDGDDAGGKAAVLLKWQNLSIPQGANIVGAALGLGIFDFGHAYGVWEVLKDWNESQATWTNRLTGTPWTQAGALSPGNDIGASVGLVTEGVVPLNEEGVEMVRNWLQNPSQNHGIIIADPGGSTDGIDFRSKEYGTVTDRPRLSIFFADPTPSAAGDLNVDGSRDGADVDLLFDAIQAELTDSVFDLNSDGSVNQSDVDHLVHTMLGSQFGDTNGDGDVDATDFNALQENLFSYGGWADGDFNGDDIVDGRDFNIWNQNKFTAGGAAQAPAGRTPRAPLATPVVVSQDLVRPASVNTGRRMSNFEATMARRDVNVESVDRDMLLPNELSYVVKRPDSQHRFASNARLEALDAPASTLDAPLSLDEAFADWGL